MKPTEKLSLISNLSTMLSSGIPIIEVVESLFEESKGQTRKVLAQIKIDLDEGKKISEALKKFPGDFSAIEVNLMKASEESGTLEVTLKDLVKAIKEEIDFNNRVRAALAYPVLVMIVFVFILTLILTFVIPKIAAVFSKLKVQLPLSTKFLIATSRFLLDYYPFVLTGLFILGLGAYFLYKSNRKKFLNFLFLFPVLSSLALEIDIARFTRSMHLLLASGIPINEALDLSKNVVDRNDVYRAVSESEEFVVSGKKLSEGLKKHKRIFNALVVKIIESGERSGKIEEVMGDLAATYDVRVSNRLRMVTTLLEPALLIVIGSLVGAMMLSIIAPIYSLIGQINPS